MSEKFEKSKTVQGQKGSLKNFRQPPKLSLVLRDTVSEKGETRLSLPRINVGESGDLAAYSGINSGDLRVRKGWPDAL